MVKNLFTMFIYFWIFILIGDIFVTIFSYFGLFNGLVQGLRFLVPVGSIIVNGFLLGKKSNSKGYLEGLKLGTMIILMFIIITLFFDKFEVKSLLYYLILLLSSIFSSMLGINKKKQPS